MIKHNLPPGDYIGISKAGTTVAVVITEGGFWAHEFRSKLQVEFEDITAVMPARPPWFVCVLPETESMSDNEPEPKPQPAFKAGDWVEIEVAGVISQQLVKLGVFADSVNAGGIEFYGNGMPVMEPSNARIIRKLDPSEVRVKVTLEGTVLPYAKQVCRNDLFWLCFGNGERKRLSTAHLDPETAALVRELLAAQEEQNG